MTQQARIQDWRKLPGQPAASSTLEKAAEIFTEDEYAAQEQDRLRNFPGSTRDGVMGELRVDQMTLDQMMSPTNEDGTMKEAGAGAFAARIAEAVRKGHVSADEHNPKLRRVELLRGGAASYPETGVAPCDSQGRPLPFRPVGDVPIKREPTSRKPDKVAPAAEPGRRPVREFFAARKAARMDLFPELRGVQVPTGNTMKYPELHDVEMNDDKAGWQPEKDIEENDFRSADGGRGR